MMGVVLSSEANYAELDWTGVETSFAPGFKALAAADVKVRSRDADDDEVLLTQGVHYSVTLAADGLVTITPIALPAAPKTLVIHRITPALQGTDFSLLGGYTADVHTTLHTAAAMRDAELKRRLDNFGAIAGDPSIVLWVDGSNNMEGPLRVTSGSLAAPGLTFAEQPNMGLRRVQADWFESVINNVQGFSQRLIGGFMHMGAADQLGGLAPAFQVEMSGRTKVRYRSGIIWDPGDTAEHAFYSAQGTPASPRPQGISSAGTNEVGQNTAWFYHLTQAAWDDDHDWTADPLAADAPNFNQANKYRTIKPYRLIGGPNFAVTVYGGPSAPGVESNGKALMLYWGAASGANPGLVVNGGANRLIKLSDGSAPPVDHWAVGKEIIVEWHNATSTWRCRANSDTAAGYTERAAFSNPNYARSVVHGARFVEAPQETSRPVNLFWATARPGEVVARDGFSLSAIGCLIGFGHGSYEDGDASFSFDPVYNYPGEMVSSGTDPMWTGNEFAGNYRHNAFTVQGWGAFSGISSSRMPGLATRNSRDFTRGVDIGFDNAGNFGFIANVTPGVTAKNITAITELTGWVNGQKIGIPILTIANHGYHRPTHVAIAGVTGTTEVNGARTLWPLDKDRLKVLGVRMVNAYTGGGTATEVDRLPVVSFDASDNIFVGGTPTNAGLQVDTVASAVNRLRAIGGTTGNPATLTVEGETNAGLIVQSKGTGNIRMLPGGIEALRLANTALGVNFWQMTPGATGNAVTLETTGANADVSGIFQTKGAGIFRFLTGGTEVLRLNRTASAVNYLGVTPGATGGNVLVAATGADADVVLEMQSRGAGQIRLLPGGVEALRVGVVAGSTNYWFYEGSTSTFITQEARGASADLDLRYVPKGNGRMRFGTFQANADAPITGYIEIKDVGGTPRKLAIIA